MYILALFVEYKTLSDPYGALIIYSEERIVVHERMDSDSQSHHNYQSPSTRIKYAPDRSAMKEPALDTFMPLRLSAPSRLSGRALLHHALVKEC